MPRITSITFPTYQLSDDGDTEHTVTVDVHPAEPDVGLFTPSLEITEIEGPAGVFTDPTDLDRRTIDMLLEEGLSTLYEELNEAPSDWEPDYE